MTKAQFGLKGLFVLLSTLAVSLACIVQHTAIALVVVSLVLPPCVALLCRLLLGWGHDTACGAGFVVCLVSSTLLIAHGAYHKTFDIGSQGYLIGDGFNSVAAAAFLGVMYGANIGLLNVLVYSCVAWARGAWTKKSE